MLNSPYRWSQWPLLPVKNQSKATPKDHGFPVMGLVFDVENLPSDCTVEWFTVYECNLFMFSADIIDDPKTVKHRYESYEAMLADGWVVD
jgi:hypothetical protein